MFPTVQADRPWAAWPPVRDVEDAFRFLDAVGAALFHRGKSRVGIPALSDVLEHQSRWEGHPMVWKDLLHEGRRVYYGTMLLGRTSLVMPELLSALYRLQGMDAESYRALYDRGVIGTAEVRVVRTLQQEGPLPTKQLRRAAGLSAPAQRTAFSVATHALMRTFTLTMVASKSRRLAGYEYVWDLFERQWPEVSEAAAVRYAGPAEAMSAVAERCAMWLDGPGAARQLFDWSE